MDKIKKLIEISHFYGKNKDFVIAGGGNTSYKNDEKLWVKASGTTLADIDESGFAVLYRDMLKKISTNQYSDNSDERERQVKKDLLKSLVDPEQGKRPSVETSMHEIINYPFVVHTHPTLVNAVMCSNNAQKSVNKLFGTDALYIEYTDPGYVLFKKVESEILKYRIEKGFDPKVICLQNHGIFVSAETTAEIKEIYDGIISSILEKLPENLTMYDEPIDPMLTEALPAIRMIMSNDTTKIAQVRHNNLTRHFCESRETYNKISLPFTPDIIVYCKSRTIFIEKTDSAESIIENFKLQLEQFLKDYNYPPKILLIKGMGMIGIEDNSHSCETILDVFDDMMKISLASEAFGGPHFMTLEQIEFIDNWEVENYRRKVAKGEGDNNQVEQKIIVVTGGAQGFGGGIARELCQRGANVVIADINEEKGSEYAGELNRSNKKNKAIFVKTDVSNEESVENLITETVKAFGGLDVFISNAGVLRAGGLDEMTLDTFSFMTKINYSGYFICSKHASKVMKQQNQYKPDYYMDIIQVNSKSGLKGSKKNFAYAGGKFGGIGLTQSFALELMPHNIKVNSICPGNFFDGPLWADPENGLFVQYLRAGKVEGAQTIEDVKKFYEKQVPAGRGCEVKDVMRAILYVVEQEYETGQAIPVTGGQQMLK
jgi:NAD(P)-dependent dehydrogenase (short-subunit alcohol dehydrogenase family)/rhamnose utilization protein RhaD (predicted bifunctional aldolase and dehydrogenase)